MTSGSGREEGSNGQLLWGRKGPAHNLPRGDGPDPLPAARCTASTFPSPSSPPLPRRPRWICSPSYRTHEPLLPWALAPVAACADPWGPPFSSSSCFPHADPSVSLANPNPSKPASLAAPSQEGSLSESLDAPAPMSASPPPTSSDGKPADDDGVEIREVWAGNLEAEFAVIRDVVDEYPYVAMDTEFPGIVCRPLTTFRTNDDYNYATLKANVDMLKLIQLGLTLSDESGALPARGTGGRACAWQFNFRGFDPRSDPANADSIDLLRKSGIDFDRFAAEGVDTGRFAELLMSSGVLLNAELQWVTFHSGYDFGYLLRLLTGRNLPETIPGFFDLIRIYFPVLYDIKHLMKYCGSLHGGLSKLAELLGVDRVGTCHQAGSDSLLTLRCFKKLKDSYFRGSTENYAGVLYGLATDGGGEQTTTNSAH